MAGGTFDKLVGKVRPGTYINFESGREKTATIGASRGTVVIPLAKADYGPEKTYIKLTNQSPDAQSAMLGYSIYDKDENRQMLLIREAFKGASTVYVYILTEGEKASKEITMTVEPAQEQPEHKDAVTNTLTATAKYGGARGNKLTVTIDANPIGGFDVIIHLDGGKVAEYEGLTTVEELIALDNPYITFTGSGDLGETAGTNLENGSDAQQTNQDVTTFLDSLESIKFNTVCFPFTEPELQQAALSKVKYIRESTGTGVQVVIPDSSSKDYEGLINVTNSVEVDGDPLTHQEVCAWVAAAEAGATMTESLTYVPYPGATAVVDPKTNEEAVEAINNGEFFFSVSEDGQVVVEYDINSLVTFGKTKDKSYRKNRLIRLFDSFQADCKINFKPGLFDNGPTGWEVMEGIGRTILRLYEEAGAIRDVSYDDDFLVDREASTDDETHITAGLWGIDGAEKYYITVITR